MKVFGLLVMVFGKDSVVRLCGFWEGGERFV